MGLAEQSNGLNPSKDLRHLKALYAVHTTAHENSEKRMQGVYHESSIHYRSFIIYTISTDMRPSSSTKISDSGDYPKQNFVQSCNDKRTMPRCTPICGSNTRGVA